MALERHSGILYCRISRGDVIVGCQILSQVNDIRVYKEKFIYNNK